MVTDFSVGSVVKLKPGVGPIFGSFLPEVYYKVIGHGYNTDGPYLIVEENSRGMKGDSWYTRDFEHAGGPW